MFYEITIKSQYTSIIKLVGNNLKMFSREIHFETKFLTARQVTNATIVYITLIPCFHHPLPEFTLPY